jgi:hypothetical protein
VVERLKVGERTRRSDDYQTVIEGEGVGQVNRLAPPKGFVPCRDRVADMQRLDHDVLVAVPDRVRLLRL